MSSSADKAKKHVKAKSASRSAKPKAPAKRISVSQRDPIDWRARTLERMRALIFEADPDMLEERKWRKPSNPAGVPTFSHDGLVCTGERYKATVKLTFANGASLPDPRKLFNAGLEGNLRRAIDIHEGETVDPSAFRDLVKAAVRRNTGAKRR
jgi:hypothetical protein